MLRKLIRDDLQGAVRLFLPLSVTLMVIGGLAAFGAGKLGEANDEAAVRACEILELVYKVCIRMLLISPLPAVLMRTKEVFTGDTALFWASLPVKSGKHILSKSIATILYFLLSGMMYATVKIVYLRTYSQGILARSVYYDITTSPLTFIRNTVMAGFVILTAMLCVQKIITGAVLFSKPMNNGTAAVWVISLLTILMLAGFYIAGYAAISRMSLFAISETSAKLLIYSYSCAFFGVMSPVFTIVDTVMLSKRAEY